MCSRNASKMLPPPRMERCRSRKTAVVVFELEMTFGREGIRERA